jgi:hypothetical protein
MTLTTWQPLSTKVDTKFADKQWLLRGYGSLTDSGHGVFSPVPTLPKLIYDGMDRSYFLIYTPYMKMYCDHEKI